MKHLYFSLLLVLTGTIVQAQCIDFTNLNGKDVTCTYGNYNNPYSRTGVVNYGSSSPSSRHTVHTNKNELDYITHAFNTVPDGEQASVRLGNWQTDSEAESVTYNYKVDAKTNPILVLKYAAVMEDPGHPASEQPRFRLEILNSAGRLIDATCGSFDFIASASLGWATANGVLYKPWTTIGLDLSDYDGQAINIRLTTYDCAQSGHFGYAYFCLSCAQKVIENLSCGDDSRITFSAPAGFTYQWYNGTEEQSTVLGTQQNVTVPVSNEAVYCNVSQVGKPGCSFTLSATPYKRYPIADFGIRQSVNCVDTLYLDQKSGISADGITLLSPLEPCESAEWDLGDGRIINQYDISHLPITYSRSGSYLIKLTTYIGGGRCSAVTEKRVYVHGYNEQHTSSMTDVFCKGSTYMFFDQQLTQAGTYKHTIQTDYGCDSTIYLTLNENPSYYIKRMTYKCPGIPIEVGNRVVTTAGVYLDTLPTINGCDSVIEWTVKDYPTYIIDRNVSVCKGESYQFAGHTLTKEGDYYDTLQTIHGCDSIIHLSLKHNPTYLFVHRDTICSRQTYTYRDKEYTATGVYDDSLLTVAGCDSIYRLELTVYPSYDMTETVNLCENTVLHHRGMDIDRPGVYYDTLYTLNDCDSVYKIIVNRIPSYQFYDTVRIADNRSYDFFGETLRKADDYTHALKTRAGCDSVYHLNLQVFPTYRFIETDTTCSNQLPYVYHGKNLYESGTYYDSLTTRAGFDSIYCLKLTVLPGYLQESYMELCEGSVLSFRGLTIDHAGVYYDTLLSHNGCDSVYKVIVNKAATYIFEDRKHMNPGGTYDFNGRTLTEPGVYFDTLQTVSGCDSIYKLVLTTNPSYLFRETDTVCQLETPYLWHGQYLYETGTYYDSLHTVFGMDSVYRLELTVHAQSIRTEYIEVCEGTVFTYRGKKFMDAGVYYDTIRTREGCDSIFKLVINKASTYYFEQDDSMNPDGTYLFHGRVLTRPGVYWDSLTTVSGCDSVYRLTLHANPVYYYNDSVVLCQSEMPYDFHGRLLHQGGTYYDSLSTRQGVDSVYRLVLTVHPVYHFKQVQDLCDGDSIYFGGRYIRTAGVYYDTLQTMHGCDSVYQLTVNHVRQSLRTDYIEVCQGSVITFRGKQIFEPGIYFDTLYTRAGCDSIFKIVVNKAATYFFETEDSMNPDGTYLFHGRVLTRPGIYYDSLLTVSGCDSVYQLTLHKNESFYYADSVVLCQSELPYNFHGRLLYQSGIYWDSLTTRVGVDSVYRLALTVHPSYRFTENIYLCDGMEVDVYGRHLTRPGTYYDTLQTVTGCDSIRQLIVHYAPQYLITKRDSINESGVYQFRNRILTQPGIYFDSLVTVSGCDSVYKLVLTNRNNYWQKDQLTICQSQTPYRFFGRNLYESGTYYEFRRDSTYQLELTVLPSYEIPVYLEICEGSVLTYRDKQYFDKGIYYDSLLTRAGCDSVFKIVVNRIPSYQVDITASICDGQQYRFGNRLLTEQGVYYDTISTTTSGCDSIMRLLLTVGSPQQIETYDTICDYDPAYLFDGNRYHATGTYTAHHFSRTGCDSIHLLHLTVLTTVHIDTTVYVCEGETYEFAGRMLTDEGTYIDTIRDFSRSLSAVRALHLRHISPTLITSVSQQEYCDDMNRILLEVTYSGPEPTAYSLRFDAYARSHGFEDKSMQPLQGKLIAIDLPAITNNTYLRPDNYAYTLQLHNDNCPTSADLYSSEFVVKYPSWIMEQNWNNVVALLNSGYNGGYRFDGYEWYLNRQRRYDATGSYLYVPEGMRVGDEVYAVLRREGESYGIATCPLTIGLDNTVSRYPILIQPSYQPQNRTVRITSQEEGTWALYSMTGQMMGQGTFATPVATIPAPDTNGCYLLRLITDSGKKSEQKIMVY